MEIDEFAEICWIKISCGQHQHFNDQQQTLEFLVICDQLNLPRCFNLSQCSRYAFVSSYQLVVINFPNFASKKQKTQNSSMLNICIHFANCVNMSIRICYWFYWKYKQIIFASNPAALYIMYKDCSITWGNGHAAILHKSSDCPVNNGKCKFIFECHLGNQNTSISVFKRV